MPQQSCSAVCNIQRNAANAFSKRGSEGSGLQSFRAEPCGRRIGAERAGEFVKVLAGYRFLSRGGGRGSKKWESGKV